MTRTLVLILLACAAPALGQTTAAAPPSAPGPHLVVVDTIHDLPRPNGQLSDMEVYHPLDLTHPWPVVLFLHGWTATPATYQTLIEDLASRGFAVAAFRQIVPADLNLGRWYQGGVTAMQALADAAVDPQSPLFGVLDMDRLAVMGHSYGGATALLLAATDARVKVAVALAPGCQPFWRSFLLQMMGQVRVPTLIVGAEFDFVVPVRWYARPMFERLPAQERLYIELARAEHLCVTRRNLVYYMLSLRTGHWERTMPASRARTISRNFANAWIENYLGIRPDTQGYVDGTAAAAALQAGDLSRTQR